MCALDTPWRGEATAESKTRETGEGGGGGGGGRWFNPGPHRCLKEEGGGGSSILCCPHGKDGAGGWGEGERNTPSAAGTNKYGVVKEVVGKRGGEG